MSLFFQYGTTKKIGVLSFCDVSERRDVYSLV